MRSRSNNWSEHELILAFNLYCKLPFGQFHHRNPRIQELASLIGRSPSAVSMKLSNFARLDPYHQKRGVKGLTHGGGREKEIWNEFSQDWEGLAYQSEQLLSKIRRKPQDEFEVPDYSHLVGKDKEALRKERVNQQFFREMVLSSYRFRCAICEIPERKLLIASHIVPWSESTKDRMNPRNGISMCAIHDAAFDALLMTFDDKMCLQVAPVLAKHSSVPIIRVSFLDVQGKPILEPDKFRPDQGLVKVHRDRFLVANRL